MDAAQFHLWREDFRREVEQVLAGMKSQPSSEPGAPAPLFPGELAALLAEEKRKAAALRRELEQARAELSRLESALKLERTRRERLKELCAKLSWALRSGPRS